MSQTPTLVSIDHQPIVHEIDTNTDETPRELTLLELIEAVSDVSASEQEVIATVTYMLNSGRIQLAGNFKDAPVSTLCG